MLGEGEKGLFFPAYDEINTNCFSKASVVTTEDENVKDQACSVAPVCTTKTLNIPQYRRRSSTTQSYSLHILFI